MAGRDDMVKGLKSQYEAIQKKTFTLWANSKLVDCRAEIRDLFKDLKDGQILLHLLGKLSPDDKDSLVSIPFWFSVSDLVGPRTCACEREA
jgi:hypothetical protein